jgi:hypothetical protein
VEVPSWPSGHVAFDGKIFEFGAGELSRVPIENLRKIEVTGPKAGRLNLKFEYQAGLNKKKTGAWVELQHQEELNELVTAVQAALGGQAA